MFSPAAEKVIFSARTSHRQVLRQGRLGDFAAPVALLEVRPATGRTHQPRNQVIGVAQCLSPPWDPCLSVFFLGGPPTKTVLFSLVYFLKPKTPGYPQKGQILMASILDG